MKAWLIGGLLLAGTILDAHAAESAGTRFKAIYQAEWAWRNGQSDISASGEPQPADGRLDDVGAASQQHRLDFWLKVQRQLEAIDPAGLSPDEQVDYAVYREQIRNFVADQQFGQWQMPFNSDSAFWSDIGYQLHGDALHSVADYQKYLTRLAEIAPYIDQQIANMRLGLARGFSARGRCWMAAMCRSRRWPAWPIPLGRVSTVHSSRYRPRYRWDKSRPCGSRPRA